MFVIYTGTYQNQTAYVFFDETADRAKSFAQKMSIKEKIEYTDTLPLSNEYRRVYRPINWN